MRSISRRERHPSRIKGYFLNDRTFARYAGPELAPSVTAWAHRAFPELRADRP